MTTATSPVVLNRRDGYVPEATYVGRPSPWGNPFRVTRDRTTSIAQFEGYARTRLLSDPDWLDPLMDAPALVCWCAPLPCHADVLVRLIEEKRNADQSTQA